MDRRQWLVRSTLASLAVSSPFRAVSSLAYAAAPRSSSGLKITGLKITPIALPDPPILAASGCHGPYFLRNIVELSTDAGIVGIGETHGGENVTQALRKSKEIILGQDALAYRKFASGLIDLNSRGYAAIELACLDAIGKAKGLRLCDLLGGPLVEQVEFAAYLFFRYAADDPRILDDRRIVDSRGRGEKSLDSWGEVRTPESMAELAWQFHKKWGFTVHKLKAGVLPPKVELAALRAINERFDGKHKLRIDPNGRWTVKTALDIGKQLKNLPLEYYEDPVRGQQAMAHVRRQTGLPMSTNSCVTRFSHIPEAVRTKPIDIVLCDHHYWGGIPACQSLGTLSRSLGWRLSQHSNNHAGVTMAAMIHVGAVTPRLTHAGDTHYVQLTAGADIIQGPKLPIVDGKMNIPNAAGVGVELDQDKLAQAHEIYKKCGMRRRDDATTMRRIIPGWNRTLF